MNILGIETSCDETSASVVCNGVKILSNVVASSVNFHQETGGIIPEQAARHQIKSIIPVIIHCFTKSKINIKNVDLIAVTVGPGLIGSLLVGVETAKTLAYLWKKPIVPVNHLVAHIYANWLIPKISSERKTFNNHKLPIFPALALVVSGGHTDLVLMKDHGKLKWIGGTRDDAAGEAFDKTARLLGLPYPGGPAISAFAESYQLSSSKLELKTFPRPMISKNNFDWSFSGLKTSVLHQVQKTKNMKQKVPRFSAEIQEAIVDVLVAKTIKAVKLHKPKSLLLAGGVAANSRLRDKFKLEIRNWKLEIDFFVPPPYLCTDNAAYVASYAFFNNSPTPWKEIRTNPQLNITGES